MLILFGVVIYCGMKKGFAVLHSIILQRSFISSKAVAGKIDGNFAQTIAAQTIAVSFLDFEKRRRFEFNSETPAMTAVGGTGKFTAANFAD